MNNKTSLIRFIKKEGKLRKTMLIIVVLLLAVVLFIAIRILRLRMTIGSNKQYWQARLDQHANPGELTYIALGDSAAQGIGASKPNKGYVGLVADSLAQREGRPVYVANISVTGARVQDVIDVQLPQLKKMFITNDTVITLDVGSNNIRDFNHDQFATQIDTLLSQLPKQTVVADVPDFGGGNSQKSAFDAGQIIAKSAQKYGLSVAHLHDETKHAESMKNYAADFFHPNDRGYKAWYSAFWQALK